MPHVGIVLAGGAARGAYEVGVLQHLVTDVARDLGHPLALDVICGSSAGALHACALAAHADALEVGVAELAARWSELDVHEILRPDVAQCLATIAHTLGLGAVCAALPQSGGLLDPGPVAKILGRVPFERIDAHVRRGLLHGVALSATHVASGRTVVFVQRTAALGADWHLDPTTVPRAARMRARHALASAAMPFLFPAVRIGGESYCDGALRQNVPLAPALHLGADALLLVNPHYLEVQAPPARLARARERGLPDAVFLLGKVLNALLLDRVDTDLARLESLNAILSAGERRFGAGFLPALNEELGHAPGEGLRPVRSVLVRASQDIGVLAAELVRSPRFRDRTGTVLGHLLASLAAGEPRREADLLSYLLFDGEFAETLMALGRHDAAEQHEALCALFACGAQGSRAPHAA